MATTTLTASREYDLPAAALWEVIADLDGYANHVTGLSRTTVLDDRVTPTAGVRRECEDTRGRTWRESTVEWLEGRRYVIEVDTSSYPADLRAVFRSFTGTWEVEALGRERCRVTITFRGGLRSRLVGGLVRRMAARAEADMTATLASYGRAAAGAAAR